MAKRGIAFGLVCVVVGLAVWAFAASDDPAGKTKVAKVRVGTFDSRAVAMAHFGKMLKDGWLKELHAEHEKAEAAGDEKLVKELEAKAQSQQDRIHMQVFGTAPVDDALREIKKDLPKLAQSAGVDVIVCIHNVAYRSPTANLVDITDQMVQLFDPDAETLKKIKGVLAHPPLPREVLEKMDCCGKPAKN